jgi:peptidoglycan/LPS O-acetylase OafA/YrhL
VNKVSPYYKALAGFIGAALVAYLSATDGGVTQAEWLKILVAGLGGSGLVYAVPNKDPKARHQDESVQPPERGAGALELVLTVIAVIVLIWIVLALVHR